MFDQGERHSVRSDLFTRWNIVETYQTTYENMIEKVRRIPIPKLDRQKTADHGQCHLTEDLKECLSWFILKTSRMFRMFRSCPVPTARVLNVLVLYIVENWNILRFYNLKHIILMNLFTHIYISTSLRHISRVSTSWNFLSWDFGISGYQLCSLRCVPRLETRERSWDAWMVQIGVTRPQLWYAVSESNQTLKHEIFGFSFCTSNAFKIWCFARIFSWKNRVKKTEFEKSTRLKSPEFLGFCGVMLRSHKNWFYGKFARLFRFKRFPMKEFEWWTYT